MIQLVVTHLGEDVSGLRGRHAWDEKANPKTLFSIIQLVVTHLGEDVSGLRGQGPF